MNRLDSGTLAALAATVTAVAALAVAIWDNVQSRAYNRLTVRPYLVVDIANRTDSGEYTLSNQGVGPAVIRGLRLHLVSEAGDTTTHETWNDVAGEIQSRGYAITGWTDLVPGRPIGVDQSLRLLSFRLDPGGSEEAGSRTARVQALFTALQVEVEYASVYGEPFTATSP